MDKRKIFSLKLGLELIIVFIGMTSAFLVNNYQIEQEEKRARQVFFKTFLVELHNFEKYTDLLIKKIDNYLKDFLQEIDKKKRPKLRTNDFTFFNNNYIIGSAFNAENFSAIGSKFLGSISRGTSLIKVINQKLQNYTRHTAQLLYFREYDPDRFYNETGQLKEEYQWYINDLREISDYLKTFVNMIKKGALPETRQLIQANQE